MDGPMIEGLIASLVLPTLAGTAVFQRQRRRIRAHQRELVPLLATLGFEPFGNREGTLLLFRSSTCLLEIKWQDGCVGAALAARRDADTWIDDDILRIAILGEPGDVEGFHRRWPERTTFNRFLSERLSMLAAALAANEPRVRQAIKAASVERDRRWNASRESPKERTRMRAPRVRPD